MEFAPMIMEAEKSQGLQPANWRPRRDHGIILVWKQMQTDALLKDSRERESEFSVIQALCSCRAFIRLDEAHLLGRATYFAQSTV